VNASFVVQVIIAQKDHLSTLLDVLKEHTMHLREVLLKITVLSVIKERSVHFTHKHTKFLESIADSVHTAQKGHHLNIIILARRELIMTIWIKL
jgi:hypothetical protein